MPLPEESWLRMLLLIWVVLFAGAIPLDVITIVRRRAGHEVRSMWVKYAAWFIMIPIFTVPLLIEFPKCYWIWDYRRWILLQAIQRLPVEVARRIWEEELGLVGKMLSKDRRNFHAWGYRRHVVAQLEHAELNGQSMVESEFEYTTKMIHVDLSNFSAWHNRSQMIPRLLDERKADDASRTEFLEKGTSYTTSP